MEDTLVIVKESTSLAIISDSDVPIVEVNSDHAIVASSSKTSAINISNRFGGEFVETPTKEFPYEIHIPLTLFDRIIEVDRWSDIIRKLVYS